MTTTIEVLELADDLDRMYDTLEPSDGWLSVVGHAGDEIRRMHTDILELLAEIDRLKSKKKLLTKTEILDEFCITPGIHQFISAFRAGVHFAEKHYGITDTL